MMYCGSCGADISQAHAIRQDDGTATCFGCLTRKQVRAAASAAEIALVTIPNVELLEVGEDWMTSTGMFTFTEDDLRSAVSAQDDPACRTPIIKLGHVDPRFDGQPSWGRILNLRTTNNDQTLLGDYVGIPAWLASIMATAYPRRSIEGDYDITSRTGNPWPFVLTAVALLGDAYPAINTLEDIQYLWGTAAPELVPTTETAAVVASGTDNHFVAVKASDMPQWKEVPVNVQAAGVRASVSAEDVRRAYYEELEDQGPGYYWWWVRSMLVDPQELIVDDDEGSLYRVPYAVSGDTITFGDPTKVKIEYVDVAASAGPGAKAIKMPPLAEGQRVMASYSNPAEAHRPKRGVAASDEATIPTPEPETGTVTPATEETTTTGTENSTVLSPEALAKLGLKPGASEEEINAAILAAATGGTGEDGDPNSQPETPATDPAATPAGPGTETETPATPDTPAPTEPTAPAVPEGMVLVDSAQWAQVQEGLKEAGELVSAAKKAERDALLDGAVRAGKFPKARRPHYEALLSADPEGTKALINSLAPGVVPIKEQGIVGGEEDVAASAASEYPAGWASSVKAANRGTRSSRVKVVAD